jgi:hypothetical protein
VAFITGNVISWSKEASISVTGGGAHSVTGNTLVEPTGVVVRSGRVCSFLFFSFLFFSFFSFLFFSFFRPAEA